MSKELKFDVKYDVGDKVYFMNNDNILVHSFITKINISKEFDYDKIKVKYQYYTSIGGLIDEDKIFKTKEECINNIKYFDASGDIDKYIEKNKGEN